MADCFVKFASEQPESAAFIGLSYRNALKRLKTRGLQFGTIIDVGAAKGEWAKLARQVWPDSGIHMVEAKPHWEQDLQALCEADDKMSYTLAGASNKEGSGHFFRRGSVNGSFVNFTEPRSNAGRSRSPGAGQMDSSVRVAAAGATARSRDAGCTSAAVAVTRYR